MRFKTLCFTIKTYDFGSLSFESIASCALALEGKSAATAAVLYAHLHPPEGRLRACIFIVKNEGFDSESVSGLGETPVKCQFTCVLQPKHAWNVSCFV